MSTYRLFSFWMMSALFGSVICWPDAARAEEKNPCIAEKGWVVSDSLRGYFAGPADGVIAQVLYRTEKDPQVTQKNEAAVALVSKDGKCLAVRRGYRKSGEVQYPHYVSHIQKVKLTDKWDILTVTSNYSHGYTDSYTLVLKFDPLKKDFKQLWAGSTMEISPRGEIYETKLVFKDVNGDGYNDLLATPAPASAKDRPQVYLWDKVSDQFVEKK